MTRAKKLLLGLGSRDSGEEEWHFVWGVGTPERKNDV